MTAKRQMLLAAGVVLLAGALAGAPAAAMGGGGDDGGSRGRSSDSGGTSGASTADDYIEAQRKVQAQDYAGAVPILERILRQEPGNADALNYMGYSQRKLGDRSKALAYYLQALANEPEHLGANEYLGELYLEMGDVAKAEERLAVISRACSGCMEETELAAKIAAFKAKSS